MPIYSLTRIADDIRSRQGDASVAVVALDGPSGGGKTKLAKRIGRALGEFVVIPVDALVYGWDGLLSMPDRLAVPLAELAAGRTARYRAWDWEADQLGDVVVVPPAPYVVVEGCGSGSAAVADLLTYLIWVEVPEDLRRQRARNRDSDEVHQHWDRWAAQENVLFGRDRTRARADLIIDGRAPVR